MSDGKVTPPACPTHKVPMALLGAHKSRKEWGCPVPGCVQGTTKYYSLVDPTRELKIPFVTSKSDEERARDRIEDETRKRERQQRKELERSVAFAQQGTEDFQAKQRAVSEAAYRRGFTHGVHKAIDAMLAGASLGAITKWAEKVTYWRHNTRDQDKPTPPPVAPPEG